MRCFIQEYRHTSKRVKQEVTNKESAQVFACDLSASLLVLRIVPLSIHSIDLLSALFEAFFFFLAKYESCSLIECSLLFLLGCKLILLVLFIFSMCRDFGTCLDLQLILIILWLVNGVLVDAIRLKEFQNDVKYHDSRHYGVYCAYGRISKRMQVESDYKRVYEDRK